MMPKKQFEAWMRQQLLVDTSNGLCKKLVLKHVNSASRMGQSILNIDVPVNEEDSEESLNDIWIEETIRLIEQTAQSDADGAGGMNNYVVQSYHGESDKPSARFTLKFHGGVDLEHDEVASEPPNKTGLLSQLMRHNEAIMRSAAIVQANALSTIQRTQSRQEMMIEKLIVERLENFELVEKLLSQKDERDMRKAQAVQQMETREKILEKVMLLAPMVVNKFASNGQKLLPEKTTALEQQIAAFADSIGMDQLEGLQKSLTPEQMYSLVDILQNIKSKQEKLTSEGDKQIAGKSEGNTK